MHRFDESARLSALARYELLDTAPEAGFDRLTALAAETLGTPVAVISLVGRDRQWFKSTFGTALRETPRNISFATHALTVPDMLVVEDALADERFATSPLVTGEPGFRCYAGAPLRTPDGFAIGALAVFDTSPRAFSEQDRVRLRELAAVVMDRIELRLHASDRARAAAGLAASETRLRTIVGGFRGIAFELDADARYVGIWTDDERLLARPRAELLGRTCREALGPEIGAQWEDNVRRVLRTGVRESFEYFFDLKTERRWFMADLAPLPGTGMVALVVHDVTELHRSMDAAKENEARYQLIANATSDVVWDWDLKTGDLWWNDAVYDVLKAPREGGLPSADWWKAQIAPQDRERVIGIVERAIANGESWTAEYRFVRGDGETIDVLDHGLVKLDESGKAIRMAGAMQDITARKKMERQVIQADRLASVGTLAAGVAHEINNPLAYVVANVGFACEQLAGLVGSTTGTMRNDLEAVLEALAEADEGAGRVRQIVRDLKTFAREKPSPAHQVDLPGVVNSAIAMTSHQIRHCANLVRSFDPIPPVAASESRLAQVFVNLLVNAAQAIGEGAAERNEIRIRTLTDEAGWAVVEISDSGPGIAPGVLSRIFDPFFTTKPVGVGTGLGLSICHGIVESIGGRIAVETKLGKGTIFRVSLPPFKSPEPMTPVPRRGPVPAGQRKRVLVIDDEVAVARGVVRMLSSRHEVVPVSSGREALERLRESTFDVILCDVMMPEMSGMAVHAEVKRRWPELANRMIFMTGGAFTEGARDFLAEMGHRRIEKPFDPDVALRMVQFA